MNEIIDNKTKSEILAEWISKLDYGDIIRHSEIANIIKEVYKTTKYYSIVSKAEKLLANMNGKRIENIPGVGYRMLEPGKYTNHALKYFKRGFNDISKGTDTLEKAPTKDMTADELDTYRQVNDRAVLLNAHMRDAVVELRTLSRKEHPMAVEHVNRR